MLKVSRKQIKTTSSPNDFMIPLSASRIDTITLACEDNLLLVNRLTGGRARAFFEVRMFCAVRLLFPAYIPYAGFAAGYMVCCCSGDITMIGMCRPPPRC